MSNELETNEGIDPEIQAVEEEISAASNMASIASKPTSVTRSDLLAKMVSYASKMNKDTLSQAVETMCASPDEVYASTQKSTGDASSKNKASIMSSSAKSDTMQSVKEDLDIVFGGSEDLSEEFRDKVSTLFEAAVTTRVEIERAKIEEQFEQQLDESFNEMKTDMLEGIDSYLSYAVAEWASENKLAIEKNIRTEVTESFLGGLKSLFDDHYLDIPEEKIDVVENMAARIEELEAMVNETTEKNIELNKVVSEKEVKDVADELAEGMTSTQKDKFAKLVEAVDFSSPVEFRKKASIIKETYFSTKSEVKVVEDQLLSESVEEPVKEPVLDPDMQMYVSSISNITKR